MRRDFEVVGALSSALTSWESAVAAAVAGMTSGAVVGVPAREIELQEQLCYSETTQILRPWGRRWR